MGCCLYDRKKMFVDNNDFDALLNSVALKGKNLRAYELKNRRKIPYVVVRAMHVLVGFDLEVG